MTNMIAKDIEDDFYKCLARFKNVKIVMDNLKKLSISEQDNPKSKKIFEKQKEELLIDLGRIGELAFKYLLKLKQIDVYPNQDYEQFSHQQAIYKKGTIKDLANKGLITFDDRDRIIEFQDANGQNFHNFTYLSLIVEALMPEVYNNYKKCFSLDYYSQIAKKNFKKYNNISESELYEEYLLAVIFPYLIPLQPNYRKENNRLLSYYRQMEMVEKTAGDIFTRLRYFSNNSDNLTYDINYVFKYIQTLIIFISGIKRNQNTLSTSPDLIYGRYLALKNAQYLKRTPKDIKAIFDSSKEDNPFYLFRKLLYKYSIEEINKIDQLCQENGLFSYEIYKIGINSEELQYFINVGITDVELIKKIMFFPTGERKPKQKVEEETTNWLYNKELTEINGLRII